MWNSFDDFHDQNRENVKHVLRYSKAVELPAQIDTKPVIRNNPLFGRFDDPSRVRDSINIGMKEQRSTCH